MTAILHVEFAPAPMPPSICARKLIAINTLLLFTKYNDPSIISWQISIPSPYLKPLDLPTLLKMRPVKIEEKM